MRERLIFLTGHLAHARLEKLLTGLGETEFDWEIVDIGVKVAALMSVQIIKRRFTRAEFADRIILPGRFRGDLDDLGEHFGVPFVRGPDEIADLPQFLGRDGVPPDLSHYDIRVFAEIVDAPKLSMEALLARATKLRDAGADVIDVGCLPDTIFANLGEAVAMLKANGFTVSVDSASTEELEIGAKAGADYLLSLTEHNFELATRYKITPILIPSIPGDLDSLGRVIEMAQAAGVPFIADPVLDPIHFGFAISLGRFNEARARWPDIELMMGTGNLTELTDADTSGMTALMIGICSELAVRNVLIVNVSPHTVRTVEEHDISRRIMFAARNDSALPRNYHPGLLQVHERRPYPATREDIDALAASVRDRNFRIMTSEEGIHIFNNEIHRIAQDAFSLFSELGVENDGAHAFYLGAELTKAETAFQLGKRYTQDVPLSWGVATPAQEIDRTRLTEAGATLSAKKKEG